MNEIEITTADETTLSGIRSALGTPYLDESGNIYVGGIRTRTVPQVDFDTFIPSSGEIVAIFRDNGVSLPLIGNGSSTVKNLFYPVSTRASGSSTGDYNSQSGRHGVLIGARLNDSGFDNVYMLGTDKTAATGSKVYFEVDNGMRIKPVSDISAGLEDGTIWVTTGGDLKYRGNGVTYSFRTLVSGLDAEGFGTAAFYDVGTGTGHVIIGNDARLTDSRTIKTGTYSDSSIIIDGGTI